MLFKAPSSVLSGVLACVYISAEMVAVATAVLIAACVGVFEVALAVGASHFLVVLLDRVDVE